MIGQRLSHFKIVEKIGEGGMGIVYKALDEKLGRNVVLKVLQPDAVGDENRRLRFMREARAAAAVTHPHIATIHEIDEADGQIFIAMELVEGKTLDRHLGSSPAAPRDGLRIAIEVAEALARAHRAGVVHRDLKPQNIIVGSDGHAKVLDFGLAKLLDDERLQDAAEATTMQTVSAEMTRDGKVLGTATYMSPEQARGLPVDTRSDLFSFGTLLYEMFTGRLPFRGATITDTLSAILRDTPEPVAQLNPEMSTELQRIIEKCLEKDAKDRYQHADDIVVDLRRLRRETDSVPVSRVESGPLSAATGRMNRAASPAWRRPATLLSGLALLAVAVIAVVGLTGRDGLIPSSKADATGLAVMPFRNLKDRDDTQRMGQILQELIITDLSGLESVTVYSSQRLQDILKQVGAGKDGAIDTDTITRVARDAGARRMLTGSLSQLGSDWTLTSQLIDVRDGSVLKSERIDGADLYSMVDELTSRLRAELGVAATAVTDSVKDKTTDSMEAYEAYLAGVDRLNANRYDEAVEHFERAVEIDPRFGQALYKLAVARWWADDAQSADPDIGARTLELALAANVKLPERGRRLAEAFLPLLKRDYAEAVPGFERLVEQYPDEKEAWYGLGEARWHSPGGSEKLASIEPFQKALDLDPSFHLVYGHMETTYTRLDMQDQAIAQVRELIDQNPDDPAWYREWIGWLARKGDLIALEGAIDEAFDHVPDLPARRRMLHVAGNLIEDPDGRETFYRRALDVPTDTDQHRTYVSLGWLYFNEKFDERAAERAFSSALDLVPTHEPALWGVYQVLRAEGRLDEVVLKSRALLARDPELETALVLWIKAAILKGDEDETVRAVGQALGESPDGNRRKWVWRNVVESYLEIGDVSRAAESAAELRTTDSGESDDPLRPLLARIEIERRNYREAGRLLEPERLAENFAARWAMMRLAIRQKNFDDAIRAADWFNKRQTGSYRVSAWLRPRILAGRYDEADRLLESELEATDSEALRRAILIHVADIYADAGEFTRAARLAERAGSLRGQPTDWSLPLLQARLSMRNRRYDDAAERLAKVTAVHPRLSWVLWHVEWNEMMRGNAAVAERMVRDRLARGPASKSAYDELALALAAQGKFREALEPAEKSLAMNADRDSYAVLAWVLVAGELDVDRGIAMAEAGCAIDADVEEQGRFAAMPSPEHALGLGLLKQGRKSEAARVLEEAARLRPQRTLIQEHLAEAR